ncbi:MAG: molybdate ABC transporter substrate-binding protein [Sporomusaceae bacterium]|nr:molybdate ABC transporter substrate-binding protein [Sporomusaceae bacterium]
MKQQLWLIAAGLLAAGIALAGCGGAKQQPAAATPPPAPIELHISAAASLKDALAEIEQNYHTQKPQVKLLFNLAASGTLQKQIEQGAPADLFISAAPKQMNELEQKQLIDKATRKNLVENKLVVIVPLASQVKLTKFEELTQAGVKQIAIGETVAVPAGQYAREVLTKLGVWDAVKDKAVFAKDVRTVLSYTETGNVEAGIVYKTDAASSQKVKVAAIAPEGSHQPIVYPLAVTSGAKQPLAAADFAAYLISDACKAIFEKHGFVMGK